LSVTIELGRR